MNKKIGMYLLIVIIVFFCLIAIELLIRGIGSFSSQIVSNIENKKQEKVYQESEKFQTDTFLETSINHLMNLVITENYEELYSLLDDDFIDYRELYEIESFKEYIQQYFPSIVSFRGINWNKYGDGYVCTISITDESGSYLKNILIKNSTDNKITVFFDDILTIENVEGEYYQGNTLMGCDILYIIRKENAIIYVTNIVNNSRQPLNGTFEESYVIKTNGAICPLLNDLTNVRIDSQESKRILFEIDNTKAKGYPAVDINVFYKSIDSTYESELSISLNKLDI